MKGRVVWFNPDLGYGFISSEDREYYFNWSSIIINSDFKTIYSGADVEFDLEDIEIGIYTVTNVKELPKINQQNGKPIILVSFVQLTEGKMRVSEFHKRISVNSNAGINFLYIHGDYIIGSDKSSLTESDVTEIVSILENYLQIKFDTVRGKRNFFNTTNPKHDILFI